MKLRNTFLLAVVLLAAVVLTACGGASADVDEALQARVETLERAVTTLQDQAETLGLADLATEAEFDGLQEAQAANSSGLQALFEADTLHEEKYHAEPDVDEPDVTPTPEPEDVGFKCGWALRDLNVYRDSGKRNKAGNMMLERLPDAHRYKTGEYLCVETGGHIVVDGARVFTLVSPYHPGFYVLAQIKWNTNKVE